MSFPQFDASGGIGLLIEDRFINTFIAGEALNAGVVVELTAAFTVKRPTAANSKKLVGITMASAVSGAKVPVLCRGMTRATAFGSITLGDQLTSGPASQPGTIQTDNTSLNTTILGMALQTFSSGATGIIWIW